MRSCFQLSTVRRRRKYAITPGMSGSHATMQTADITEPDLFYTYFHSSRIPTAADPNPSPKPSSTTSSAFKRYNTARLRNDDNHLC